VPIKKMILYIYIKNHFFFFWRGGGGGVEGLGYSKSFFQYPFFQSDVRF
jgi:hypothetical protein